MSTLADSGPIGADHPPLGELLVHRGLLTAEQLAAAIAEQSRSRRPLGEILIALGFVSAATIAQALATQHGSLLKTEYGYATGFDSETPAGIPGLPPATVEPAHAAAPVAAPPPPLAQTAPVAAPLPPPVQTATPVAAPLPPPAPAVVEPAPLPAPEPAPRVVPVGPPPPAAAPVPVPDAEADGRWAGQVHALEHRLDEAFAQVEALSHQREELAAAVAERDAAIERLRGAADALQERIDHLGALEADLAEARAARPEVALSVDAEAFTNRVAELEDALVIEVAGKNELEAAVTERDDRLRALEELVRDQPWASSERHLLFFRGADGYALVELDGPPPLPGARIDAPGATDPQIVTRVALAPLPGHALPCAYLVAA